MTTQTLDRLFSLKVRSVNRCELRGLGNVECSGVLDCAHIIQRSNMRLRWDVMNALCICRSHHEYYHREELKWLETIEKHFNAKYVYIMEHRGELVKNSLRYRNEIRATIDL